MPEPPATRPIVAAFDVDGTLTTLGLRDAVSPRAAGAELPLALARHPVALARALARRDRDRLKELASASLRGLDSAALDRLGSDFGRTIHLATAARRHDRAAPPAPRARSCRDPRVGVARAVRRARSASCLGVDDVVCTRLERDAAGRLTGRLLGANCRGAEKARRVGEWLAEAGLAGAELWAYGDSASDDELLATADHPVRVDGVWIAAEPGRITRGV